MLPSGDYNKSQNKKVTIPNLATTLDKIAANAKKQYEDTKSRDARIIASGIAALAKQVSFTPQYVLPHANSRGVSNSSTINNGYLFSSQNRNGRPLNGGQFSGVTSNLHNFRFEQFNGEYNNALKNSRSHMGALGRIQAKYDNTGKINYSPYALSPDVHASFINEGANMMDDQALYQDYNSLDMANLESYDSSYLEGVSKRIERDEEFYDMWTVPEMRFDVESGEWVETRVFRKDAPLPPWVAANTHNLAVWDYFLDYQDATSKAQNAAAINAFNEKLKADRLGYKSAMAEEDGIGVENSLIDAMIVDHNINMNITTPFKPFQHEHLKRYVSNYLINPIKAGEWKVLAGNILMGLGDDMDAFARGERAIVAASRPLGGMYDDDHSAFENQKIYWINIKGYSTSQLHDAQRVFVQNGGLSLINPDEARLSAQAQKSGIAYKSLEEREAYIAEKFKENGINIPWEDVRDAIEEGYYNKPASEVFTQFISDAKRNLKDTYSTAGYDFNANTGDLVSDIAVETLTDPGLLFGGIAKSILKGGVGDASKSAVLKGLRASVGDADVAAVFNKKEVRAAIKHLSKVDDGRNIIFKRTEALSSDVKILADTLDEAGIFASGLDKENFIKATLADLVERGKSMNANVISSTPRFLSNMDNKILKTAYYVDKGIDKIDTILLKTSFAAPFIMADTFKLLKKGLSVSHIGKLVGRKFITNGEVVQALAKGEGKGVRVMSEELIKTANASEITGRDLMRGVRRIRSEFDNTAEAIERAVGRVQKGKTSIQDAVAEVEEYIKLLTNGDYKTIDELEQWVSSLDPIYRNEYEKGLEILRQAKFRFDNHIDLFNDHVEKAFLKEISDEFNKSKVWDIDAFKPIFEKYANNIDFEHVRKDLINLIGEDNTHLLIEGTEQAIKNGLIVGNDDVLLSISKLRQATGTKLIHRSITAADLKKMLPSSLSTAMATNGDKWIYSDLKRVLSRTGDVNYADVYDAIDNALYNLTYAYGHNKVNKYMASYNELKALQDAVRHTDVIATNSVETISELHLDLQTTLTGLLNDVKVREMLDDYYDNLFKDVFDQLDSLNFSDIPKEEQGIYVAINQLRKRRESIRMYENFKYDIENITGISDAKAYAICSAVLGQYSGGKDVLTEITRNASGVWDYLNEIVFNNYGGSKLNMNVLKNQVGSLLTSKPDDFFANSKFYQELNDPDKVHVRNWLSDITKADMDNPQAYADMQMITTILMNPNEVKRLNHMLENGEQPIFLHVSTTGFNAESDTITAIGYRKWRKIEDPDNVTLEDVYNIFRNDGDPVEFRVSMTDDEIAKIPHATLKAIYSSEDSDKVLRARFSKLFGGAKDVSDSKSEGDVMERFFKFLYDDQTAGQGRKVSVKPYTFVVHDLQSSTGYNAFNMRMLNGRARAYATDSTKPYMAQYISKTGGLYRQTSNNTINTLTSFRELIPDNGFTASEFYEVEKTIKAYAAKRSDAAMLGYSVMDFDGYVDDAIGLNKALNQYKVTDDTSEYLKTLINNNANNQFDSRGVLDSVNRVQSANDLAKQYMVLSGVASNKKIGSLSYASSYEVAEHMSGECQSAFNNIAGLFGIDLSFNALEGAGGHRWAGHGNKILGTSEIVLNPYAQHNMVTVLTHELNHEWFDIGKYSSSFKTDLKKALVTEVSKVGNASNGNIARIFNLSKMPLKDPSITDALEQYINYIGARYNVLVPLTDGWMNEFIAPIFEYYFTNIPAMEELYRRMIHLGFNNSPEGKQALAFLESFSTLLRNSDELHDLSFIGKLKNGTNAGSMLNDCLYRLTKQDTLMDECAYSILNSIKNKDTLQKQILDAVSSSNPTIEARIGKQGPNILNTKARYSISEIRKYYDLGDSYASEKNLIDTGVAPGKTAFGEVITNDIDRHYSISWSLSTIEKMSDNAEWISRTASRDLTSEAAALIQPYNDDAVKLIDFLRNYTLNNNVLSGSSSYDYLKYTVSSSSPIDNYLMCQRIYDDVLKYISQEGLEQNTSFMRELKTQYDAWVAGGNISDDFLSVLNGDLDLKIYKSGRISDQYARRFHYTVGSMENEIEKARCYRNATYEIASNLNQRDHASLRLRLNGIRTAEDSMIGRAYQSVLTSLDSFSSRVTSKTFQNSTLILSNRFYEALHAYRLDRLRVDGVFDEERIISELLWNGHNHIAFQTANYASEDIKSLIDYMNGLKSKGMDYLSCEYDDTTGKLFIFINNNAEVYSDTHLPVEKRYLVFKDGKYSRSYTRPEFQNLHTREILRMGDDFPESYDDLLRAWQNIDILSGGASRGTSGRVLSNNELEHYYNTLPPFMKDMCSPKNLFDSSATDRLIYDPGFIVEGDTDYFLDMLDTMRYQNKVMNNGTATLAYMFGNGAPTKFGNIMQDVPDDEVLSFFSKDSDFVVATLVPNNNMIYGVEMKQLRMDSARAVEYARQTDNAVVLPYDTYVSVLSDINRNTNPASIRASFNQALLVIKAFQLCNVGSWVRNWYDATKKAAMDMGETPSNVWTLLMYQGKAMKDFSTFRKIIKSYEGYVDGYSWDIIKKTFDTDMTYDDFVILSNMFYSDKTTLNTKIFKQNDWRRISGNESGVRGLSEADINKAYKQTYGNKVAKLDKDTFIGIQQGRIVPTADQALKYEDMVKEIDTYLRSTRLKFTPQKATNIVFHPFSLSENIVRYAQTQYLRDYGMTNSQISKRIHLTQFDSRRSTVGGYLEHLIPYANYTFDNCMYWMRMIEENPRYFKYFSDAYGNIVSSHIEDLLDKGQEFDLDRDNMVRTGGIPIGHNGMYFKLNPSFLDFVNNMYGGMPNVVEHLNPLLNLALRNTLSDYGFGSKYFFRDLDLNLSEDAVAYNVSSITPILNQIYSYQRAYKRSNDYFGDDSGMSTKLLFTIFAPLIGLPVNYGDGNASTFKEWQDELAKQGKWFDCNKNAVVDMPDDPKLMEYGANNPNNSWEDTNAYMLVHFGKIWDGNQGKFVDYWDYTYGGFNDKFDFNNDPTAWDRLCALYETRGKVFDYNTGHFVYRSELSDGDLNDPDLDWERKCELMYEKYNKVWDANRNKFVLEDDLLSGGLNDTKVKGRSKAALRLALFGQEWDKEQERYVEIQDPSVVLFDNLVEDRSDNIYSMLGIPRISKVHGKLHVNNDGLLMTEDGKYVLTHDSRYNEKVFDKVINIYGGAYESAYSGTGVRSNSSGWHNNNYRTLSKLGKKKPAKVKSSYNPYVSQTGYGWNSDDMYYSYAYRFRYKFNNPPSRIKRTVTPHIQYVYGGGYKNRYLYQTR